MNDKSTIINIDEILKIFKEDCKRDNIKFSEQEFQKFLEFLEIDFYDWVKENLKQFSKSC